MPAQRDVLDFQQCRQFALSCAFVAAQKHHHTPLRTRQAKRPRLPVEPVAQLPRDIVQQETKAAVQISSNIPWSFMGRILLSKLIIS